MDDLLAIRDIAPPVETLPGTTIWPWIIIPLLLVAGLMLYRFFRKVEPEPAPTPQLPPTVSPMQEALQALDELIAEELVETGKTKLFFTKLNMIFRTFLAGQLDMRARVRTTSEILEAANDYGAAVFYEDRDLSTSLEMTCDVERVNAESVMPSLSRHPVDGADTDAIDQRNPSHTALLSNLLQECDLFKFANVMAQADIARSAHGKCRDLVIAIGGKEVDA